MNQVISSNSMNIQSPIVHQDDNTHKKMSAFFLNAEKALAKGPDSELYEARLRAQLYSIIAENAIGELFDWDEPKLFEIVKKELITGMFCNMDLESMEGGFIMGDFDISGENEPTDALLYAIREEIKDVPNGIFKEFCDNYRNVKINPSNHAAYIKMRTLLYPNIIKLGYFNWLRCRDKWAQALVYEAKEKWNCMTDFNFSLA